MLHQKVVVPPVIHQRDPGLKVQGRLNFNDATCPSRARRGREPMFFEFAVFSQQHKPWSQSLIVHKSHLVGGIPTPLKNHGVRQMG